MNKPTHNKENTEWFEDWFDSPYYHKLYNNRDNKEADFFISNIMAYLKLPATATIWDLACGKGRHAIKLNQMGYKVVGTDLSENSIKEANKQSNNNLDFYVHDMRTPFRINYFDSVFNFFTSFGYFKNETDSFKVFETVFESLKPSGLFVIDFFNADRVKSCLVENMEVKKEDIDFKISKTIKDKRITKRISFVANGKEQHFEENVFLYDKNDFLKFADKTGFKLTACFGDYSLNTFDEQNSERLILIFSK